MQHRSVSDVLLCWFMFNYLCLLREGIPTAELFGISAAPACIRGRHGPFIYSLLCVSGACFERAQAPFQVFVKTDD